MHLLLSIAAALSSLIETNMVIEHYNKLLKQNLPDEVLAVKMFENCRYNEIIVNKYSVFISFCFVSITNYNNAYGLNLISIRNECVKSVTIYLYLIIDNELSI